MKTLFWKFHACPLVSSTAAIFLVDAIRQTQNADSTDSIVFGTTAAKGNPAGFCIYFLFNMLTSNLKQIINRAFNKWSSKKTRWLPVVHCH